MPTILGEDFRFDKRVGLSDKQIRDVTKKVTIHENVTIKVTCDVCGREFETKKPKYCSGSCKVKASRSKQTIDNPN